MIDPGNLVIVDDDETSVFSIIHEHNGRIWLQPYGVTSDHRHLRSGGRCCCERHTLVQVSRVCLAPSYSINDIHESKAKDKSETSQ